ncbi:MULTISPECIES: ABC transporter substrate-binding protein [unclassified Acinetobacter]|uniref:ABC transporter substrate-binding protein n=1 Tax=unclassified Acinetobacter TaxID=196816 RepID=UPI0035BA63A2
MRTSMMKFVLVPSVLAASLALIGCGGSDNKSSAASATAGSAKIDPNVLADKQELVINNGTEPATLDPHKAEGNVELNLIRQMFDGLLSTDRDGKTIAGIAEKWESPDNKVWTFHLRDAKWSNGDPVTAEDFVYSFRRLVDPKTASPYATYLDDARVVNAKAVIDGKAKPEDLGVKAIDAKTFQVTLSEAVPYFPDMLVHGIMRPVHKATVEKFGDKWTDPANIVVNGAFKPTQWNVNDKIVMERNASYYDNASNKINKVTYLALNDGTSDLARYRAGEIDMSSANFPDEQFAAVKQEMGDQLTIGPSLCTYYYAFNMAKPPFNDPRVRKALVMTLDRETFTKKVMNDRGEKPAYQFTPTSIAGGVKFEPEWKSWDQNKRVEEAKKLLTEAGYSQANPLKFELLYNTDEGHKKYAIAASEMWKQFLGGAVSTSLVNQEWKTFLETRRKGNYQMARAGWCGDFNEGATFLNIFKSTSTNNDLGYKSEAFDNILAQSLAVGANRVDAYNKAEAQLSQDNPALFVYHYISISLNKPYVLGVSHNDPLHNSQVKYYSIAKH